MIIRCPGRRLKRLLAASQLEHDINKSPRHVLVLCRDWLGFNVGLEAEVFILLASARWNLFYYNVT